MPEDKHLLIVTRQACLDCKTIHEIKGLIQIIYHGLILRCVCSFYSFYIMLTGAIVAFTETIKCSHYLSIRILNIIHRMSR